jgi:parallel beta-helix repeat protein
MTMLTSEFMDEQLAMSIIANQWFVRLDGNDANTGKTNTAGGAFLTLAHALSVALPGDTVTLNDGLFQFTPLHLNTPNLNYVTISSVNGPGATTLMVDADAHYAANAGALFQVSGVVGLNFVGLTISGQTTLVASSCVSLVLVNGFGLVGLFNCHLTLAQYDFELLHPVAPLPTPVAAVGFCVRAGDVTPLIGQPPGSPGSCHLHACTLDLWQKAGAYVDGRGSNLILDTCTITGLVPTLGPTPDVLQNCLRMGNRATALVYNCAMSGVKFNGPAYGLPVGYADAIVALTTPGILQVMGVTIGTCDNGARLLGAAVGTRLNSLAITSPTHNGIWLGSAAAGCNVQQCTVTGAASVGLYVEAGCANNTLSGNTASGSTTFDAQDLSAGSGTAGTANNWLGNTLTTKSPAGLA